MKRTLLLALIIVLSIPNGLISNAQGSGNAKVVGIITDAVTGDFLIGTNVALSGTSLGESNGLDGGYSIPNVPPGTYTIVFRYIGYKSTENEIQLSAGETLELNMELSPDVIMGEEIVVTVQARGQRAAINQQLSANAITNIVSSEKIRDVPDANAAESIGRLPGVSLRRVGGEGNQIVVRGLSPQYTIVEVDGVRMQGVGLGRDVGLSIISSEALDGIELTKSLTPDKDADAIGGVVNLRTRTAKEGLNFGVLSQGGYNSLENSFANYKFGLNLGNRFLDNSLGILATGTAEQVWRSSDRYTAGYLDQHQPVGTDDEGNVIYEHHYYTENENIREYKKLRQRYSGALVLDYKTNFMTLKLNNTYNRMVDENIERVNQFRYSAGDFRHLITDDKPVETIQTHALTGIFKFLNTELTLDAQYSKTNLENSSDQYIFEDNWAVGGVIPSNVRLYAEPYTLWNDYNISSAIQSYLDRNIRNSTFREDITQRVNLDYRVPYTISEAVSGAVQVGGSYSVKKRSSDRESYWSYYFGGIGGDRANRVLANNPDFYHWNEPGFRSGGPLLPGINFVDSLYDYGSVLKGVTGVDLTWSGDMDKLKRTHDYFGVDEEGNPLYPADQTYVRGVESSDQDYQNREEYLAGYIMAEILIGRRIMLIPGVRYENLKSTYTANYVVTNDFELTGMVPGYPEAITVDDRENTHWFPSLNIKVDITDWMDVRGAYYKSATRPNYGLLSPAMISNQDKDDIAAYNPYLKPGIAHNFELGVSAFTNKLGLLTFNIFYKELSELLYRIPSYNNYYFEIAEGVPPSLVESLEASRHLYREDLFSATTIPPGSATMDDYPVNNPNVASFRGFEVSWQTNFWYLPGLLKGFVLDLNYSYIRSKTHYPYLDIWNEFVVVPPSPIPQRVVHADYATREGTMLDQPNSIYNARIGWDYKGFSTRLSFRYQGNSLQDLNPTNNNQDRYRKEHFRMDLLVQQRITDRLSVWMDVANLTSALDEFYNTANGLNLPSQLEYYGLTAQISVRFEL